LFYSEEPTGLRKGRMRKHMLDKIRRY